MPAYGKVDGEFFEEHIYPHLGAERGEIAIGPQHGVDFGVIDLGSMGHRTESDAALELDERSLVVATDPISILPELGFERAGRFAFEVVCADVAVSGFAPAYLSLNFTLPPAMTDAEFATFWEALDREASDMGASIVAGHTARYEGCSYPWVGGATVMGVGSEDDIVRPDGARPGDALVLTTGPAVEAVGLLTTLFGDEMALPETTIGTARERLSEARTVRDALAAAAAGPVTAMHDVTEGGLRNALCEMATSTGARFDIERERVPMRPGVEAVCEYLDIDPWAATSAGTLLIAVESERVEPVLDALDARDTTAAVVGSVAEGVGAYVDGERVEPPDGDPSWDVYAEYGE